jgi:hypothetical protein
MSDGTYNHLGDHTQWSNARMTGVGLSIACGVAGAFTASLMRAAEANRRPVRVLSAQAMQDAEVTVLRAGLSLMKHRLQYSQRAEQELAKRVAELEAEALERAYRGRF